MLGFSSLMRRSIAFSLFLRRRRKRGFKVRKIRWNVYDEIQDRDILSAFRSFPLLFVLLFVKKHFCALSLSFILIYSLICRKKGMGGVTLHWMLLVGSKRHLILLSSTWHLDLQKKEITTFLSFQRAEQRYRMLAQRFSRMSPHPKPWKAFEGREGGNLSLLFFLFNDRLRSSLCNAFWRRCLSGRCPM